MSEQEREELSCTNVHHSEHKLKSGKEELIHKQPEQLKKRRRRVTKKKQRRSFLILLAIFFLAIGTLVVLLYDHWRSYPGIVYRDTVHAKDNGKDFISLDWEDARNAVKYDVYVKEFVPGDSRSDKVDPGDLDDSWTKYITDSSDIKISGLDEGKSYSFIIRPISERRTGVATRQRNFRTKRSQSISVGRKITKLTASKPFKIDVDAMTDIVYESSDTDVAEISPETGEIVPVAPGITTITVRAVETEQYEGDSDEVELEVIESYPVRAGGARPYNIYHLDAGNCTVVKEITGAGGAVIPQSLGYTGDKYIVAYGMGSPDRIITFDVNGDGKYVSVPKIALGHPNGFTYADENRTCYCVKGWSSRAVTYEPDTESYGAVNLSYGCSGIAYDRKERLLYTSSRTVMASYSIEDGYSVVNTCGVVSHSNMATQDIGGHAGIMIRCLSPNSNTHGTNYIDLYDMREGMYLGTISCDLSEVESAVVNNEGFLEILANNSGDVDYIWRTDINIETLGEGIDYGD